MDGRDKLIEKVKVDKIEWKGIDGLIVAVFFIVSLIIWVSILNKSDIVIGYIIPISLAVFVTVIFIAYLREILKFSKRKIN